MTWQESEWNLHEERKDAWKILKHHTEVASDRIYEELPEILQHSFDEGVAYAREQIAQEIEAQCLSKKHDVEDQDVINSPSAICSDCAESAAIARGEE